MANQRITEYDRDDNVKQHGGVPIPATYLNTTPPSLLSGGNAELRSKQSALLRSVVQLRIDKIEHVIHKGVETEVKPLSYEGGKPIEFTEVSVPMTEATFTRLTNRKKDIRFAEMKMAELLDTIVGGTAIQHCELLLERALDAFIAAAQDYREQKERAEAATFIVPEASPEQPPITFGKDESMVLPSKSTVDKDEEKPSAEGDEPVAPPVPQAEDYSDLPESPLPDPDAE